MSAIKVAPPIEPRAPKIPFTDETDAFYFAALRSQLGSKKKPLKIGKNFIPSAMMSEKERHRYLNMENYSDLRRMSEDYEAAARSVVITLHPMNGGIGSSIKRENYIKGLWTELGRTGDAQLGSKGSDLYFEAEADGSRAKLSISQAKILRLLLESDQYKRIDLQHYCSSATIDSVRRLLQEKVPGQEKSYLQAMMENQKFSWIEPAIQSTFPCLDENGEMTDERMAPGGHGYWGVRLLLAALKMRISLREETLISAVYNEDGINNGVDRLLSGYMAAKKIPLMMLFTTKTQNDRKGGLLGIVQSPNGSVRKKLLEKAEVIGADQERLFEEMGLTKGEPAGQYFNTNTALFNYNVLSPFLQELVDLIGKKTFLKHIHPDLIQNAKTEAKNGEIRRFVQLEGTIGSALLNLDGYLSTTANSGVRELMEKYGFIDEEGRVRFLKIVKIDVSERLQFFTPIKNAFDFWLQFYSGAFTVNPRSWRIEPQWAMPLPLISLSDRYDDIDVVLDQFNGAEVYGLQSLEARGNVNFSNTQLSGCVKVASAYEEEFHLSPGTDETRWPLNANGKPVLKNVSIFIEKNGEMEIKPYAKP